MNQLANIGIRTLVAGQSLATNATNTGNYVDTRGFNSAKILIPLITGGGTQSIPATIIIGHTDDTNSWGTLASATTSTSGYPTALPTTAGTTIFAEVNIPNLTKRYLRVSIGGAGAGTSATIAAYALLGRANESPTGTNTGAQFNWDATAS